MGAALAMLTNEFIVRISYPDGGDLARMGAQVISGIGFLGAGTIIVIGKMKVSGLTTAAGLWASAAVGIASGIGFYAGAIIGGVFIYVVMVWLHKIDPIGRHKSMTSEICVELESISKFKGFLNRCEENAMNLENLTVERVKESAHLYVTFTTHTRTEAEKTAILEKLLETDGVIYVQDLH
jgi:putative Mg2+ transporter-C (MgtC) family protein